MFPCYNDRPVQTVMLWLCFQKPVSTQEAKTVHAKVDALLRHVFPGVTGREVQNLPVNVFWDFNVGRLNLDYGRGFPTPTLFTFVESRTKTFDTQAKNTKPTRKMPMNKQTLQPREKQKKPVKRTYKQGKHSKNIKQQESDK